MIASGCARRQESWMYVISDGFNSVPPMKSVLHPKRVGLPLV